MRNSFLYGLIVFMLTPIIGLGQGYDLSTMTRLRKEVQNAESKAIQQEKNDSLRAEITDFLSTPFSYDIPVKESRFIGDLFSPDNAFRMLTWNISNEDGTYSYFCFIQLKPKGKDGNSKWFELKDQHRTLSRPENKVLNKDKWFGALYYSIIPFKHNRKMVYVLLGWEGNDRYSNKKIMESLYFDKNDNPMFGKPVFQSGRIQKRRVVFEFSKEAYMMLRFNDRLNQIVFNRLEPMKPELEGIYSYYTPTLTYDAYELKKGIWVVVENVNPRNEKDNREYHTPPSQAPPSN